MSKSSMSDKALFNAANVIRSYGFWDQSIVIVKSIVFILASLEMKSLLILRAKYCVFRANGIYY